MSDKPKQNKSTNPQKSIKSSDASNRRIPRDYFKIDDAPENVARIIMNTKPKKRGEWDFQQKNK